MTGHLTADDLAAWAAVAHHDDGTHPTIARLVDGSFVVWPSGDPVDLDAPGPWATFMEPFERIDRIDVRVYR